MLHSFGLKIRFTLGLSVALFCLAIFTLVFLQAGLKLKLSEFVSSQQVPVIQETVEAFNLKANYGKLALDGYARELDSFGNITVDTLVFNKGVCLYSADFKALKAFNAETCSMDKPEHTGFKMDLVPAASGFEPVARWIKPVRYSNNTAYLVGSNALRYSEFFKDVLKPGIFFISSNRTILHHSNPNLVRGAIEQGANAVFEKALSSGEIQSQEIKGLTGVKSVVTISPTSIKNLYLGQELESSLQVGGLMDSLNITFIVVIALLSVGFMASAFIVKWITHPLAELTKRAKDKSNTQLALADLVKNEGGALLELAQALDWRSESLILKKKELIRALAEYELITKHSSDLICKMDTGFRLSYASPCAMAMLGIHSKELIGSKLFTELFSLEDRAALQEALMANPGKEVTVQHKTLDPTGKMVWLETTARVIGTAEDNNREIVTVSRDITSRKNREEHLSHLAYHDGLTGLANRLRMQEALNEAIEAKKPFGLLMLDLDKFKKVNDTMGHDTGDELLIEMGKRLRASVRASDLVARLGGDEFVVLVRDKHSAEESSIAVSKKILENVKPLLKTTRGFELRLHTSIGVGLYPEHGTTATEVMKNADLAMYASKQSGGGSFIVYANTTKHHNEHSFTKQEILEAIAQESMEMYWQPVVDKHTGRVSAIEGLLRWNHKDKGLISPAEIFRLVNKEDALVELGKFALNRGMLIQQALKDQGNIKIILNISARQIGLESFFEYIQGLINKNLIIPSLLEFDLGEASQAIGLLENKVGMGLLSKAGAGITVDDNGQGYVYFSRLSELGVTGVKIDVSNIKATEDSERRMIIKGLTEFAHSLQWKTMAKGIEAPSQVKYLEGLSIDYWQGFHLAKPMPTSQVCTYLVENEFMIGDI